METAKLWLLGSLGTVLIAGSMWYLSTTPHSPDNTSPVSGSEMSTTTVPEHTQSTTIETQKQQVPVPAPTFPIHPSDVLSGWSFKGAYAGNDTLIKNATTDIEHLKALLGKGTYDDYDIYVGIANDAVYLGDGATAYENYNRAIAIHPNKGLAYMNLGHLMDELGAYHTAAAAYAKAVAVEPAKSQFRNAQTDFLEKRFPEGVTGTPLQ